MRGELAVRIFDGTTDRHVTRHVSDLRFTKAAPGGYLGASMRLNLPRNTFDNLGPVDKCWIYDARTGRTLLEGFTQNPGVLDGPDGQGFDLSVIGTTVLATDETRALIYVDQSLNSWERATTTSSSANVESGSQIAGTDYAGVQMQFPSGSVVGTNAESSAGNYTTERAGMTLGAIHAVLLGGKADANWAQEFVTPAGTVATGTLAVGPSSFDIYVGSGGGSDIIPVGTERFAFRLIRTGGATTVGDENTWFRIAGVSVLGRRMDKFGTLVTGAAGMGTAASVTASQVVEDLLGRILTLCDKQASTVDATTFEINQLAYIEAVNSRRVLEDLADFEPDYLWEMLHSTPEGYVFNYRAWPTTVRYEISTADGYNKSGGDVDLCNRIAVTWVDEAGRSQVEIVTTTVPELDAAGRTRDAEPATLPEGRGSPENAQRHGQQVLAAKNEGPKAATARVGRRIRDHLRGAWVEPWEIEPGYMVSVRETGDLLRLTQMEYSDPDGSASLQLGLPTPTMDERVAQLVIDGDRRRES